MTPLTAEKLSIQEYPPPARREVLVQLIQGWYYLFLGLCVALAIGLFQSDSHPTLGLTHLWFIRGLGVFVALVGVYLIRASRFAQSSTITTVGPTALSVLLGIGEVAEFLNSILPAPFLMDTVMQFGFFFWWMLAIHFRKDSN
jgi:hypothetical protein